MNLNNKIVIGFVSYDPPEELRNRIFKLLERDYKVYLYDNSPKIKFFDSILESEYKNNFYYVKSHKNMGLAVAMNDIFSKAYEDKNNFLLFLDQDTVFSEETINFADELSSSYFDEGVYSAISMTNEKKQKDVTQNIINNHLFIRNSGSIFSLKNLMALNWFNPSYFVDGVDYEFSLRSKKLGYKIGICEKVPGFDHISEQGYSYFYNFGLSIHGRKYNIIRIKDVIISSTKTITYSLMYGEFIFAFKLLKIIISFLLIQLFIRISFEK